MPYTLQPKPVPKKLINWALAPASLVGCCPLIQGEDPVTTLEYVSRLPGDINTFVPGTFGATTWQSWGINMNGGGVDGARGVGLPSTVLATMDPHRRTIAWAQRFTGPAGGSDGRTAFYNARAGLAQFTIQASAEDGITTDPVIAVNFGPRTSPPTTGADSLDGNATTSLMDIWHAIVVSWSDGTGTDPTVGIRIWDNGVLIASKATHDNPLSPGDAPDTLGLVGHPNAATSDFEYWYELNEFLPATSDIPGKLYADPYYFFRDASPPAGPCDPVLSASARGIKLGSIAYSTRPDPRVYLVREDGQLIALTFFVHEKVIGFTRIITDGLFEAVAIIPRAGGGPDQVWAIVKRTVQSSVQRYIEYFEDSLDLGRSWRSLQTDCAVVRINAQPSNQVTGLEHLEGEIVDVVADGAYRGTFTVTSGTITLDADYCRVEVGLHYDSKATTMRPAFEGAVIEGLPRSWDTLWARLRNTIGGRVNGELIQYPGSDLDALELFTGDRKVTGQAWGTEGRITVEQIEPYPMTLLALFGTLSTGDHD